jgi:hypothetical protein
MLCHRPLLQPYTLQVLIHRDVTVTDAQSHEVDDVGDAISYDQLRMRVSNLTLAKPYLV